MKRMILISFVCVCVGILSGCTGGNANHSSGTGTSDKSAAAVYQKITAAQAKAMMDDGSPYILVDVRTEAEYQAQRIDGATLIPVDVIGYQAATKLPDKSARILVYCRSGNRSNAAAHTLVGLGYTNVYDMGGIISWTYGTVSG